MTLLLKDPAALLDYAVDWGADYLNEDEIVTSTWSIEPTEPGGLTVISGEFGLLGTSVKVGGGVVGRLYRLANHVRFVTEREDTRSILLRVEDR